MKTLRLAIACLAIATSRPSVLHAQNAGAGSLERTLTGNPWDVTMELAQRAWGRTEFRDNHEFSTMNGYAGGWKVTGVRTVELGSMYVVEFAPGLESFVVSMKASGVKVATGKKMAARVTGPLSLATITQKPVPASATKTDGRYTTISLAEIANHPINHLMNPPKGRVSYLGVPFEFSDPPRSFETENYWGRRSGTSAVLKADVPRPSSVRVIITGAGAGNPAHQGKETGVLKFTFADGSEYKATIKVGTTIRPETWRPDSVNGQTPPGDDVVKVTNVVSEPQRQKRGRDATGFLDMLTIDLPASKALTSLSGITITDTSRDTIGVLDPGFEISAITVVQAAAPVAAATTAAAPVSGARTIPDPFGLKRSVVVPDKPLGITLPPLPGSIARVPQAAVPANLPGTMRGRAGAGRAMAMQQNKMKTKSEMAVLKGLRWLVQNQNADGSWGDTNQSAMTGFAVLCFFGHGETPESVEFGQAVNKGITWLLKTGTAGGGRFATFNQSGVYEHAIATYAVGEYYVMTRDERVKELFKQAIGFIVQGQGNGGGWMYSYDKTADDLSVSGWQFQALKVAHLSRLDINGVDMSLDKAIAYIERVKGPKGGYGYRGPGDKYSLTGIGILCELYWKGERGILRKGMEWVLDETEKASAVKYHGEQADLYAWYYHTQACFMFGGAAWTKWNRWFQDEIADSQAADGSWPRPGAKSAGPQSAETKTGAVYRTTLCTLMLEVFYRYLPTIPG